MTESIPEGSKSLERTEYCKWRWFLEENQPNMAKLVSKRSKGLELSAYHVWSNSPNKTVNHVEIGYSGIEETRAH